MTEATRTTLTPWIDWPRWASLGLAVVGIVDSLYLTWIKLARTQALCTGVGDCEAVNNSVYSEINGMPIAVLGLGMYLAIILLLVFEDRVGIVEIYGPQAVFGLALTGALYSAYLTYLELFVIHAVCPYCVVSAVVVTGIFILSSIRLRSAPPAEGTSPTD